MTTPNNYTHGKYYMTCISFVLFAQRDLKCYDVRSTDRIFSSQFLIGLVPSENPVNIEFLHQFCLCMVLKNCFSFPMLIATLEQEFGKHLAKLCPAKAMILVMMYGCLKCEVPAADNHIIN